MKHKNIEKILVFVLFLVALASFAAAEQITYTYRTLGDELLATDTINVPSAVSVTLPNTNWKLEFLNNDSKFKINIPTLNYSDASVLNITARLVNLADQTYDANIGLSGTTYIAKYAYAFNVSQLGTKTYTLTIDYSGTGVTNPKLFKCDFDFNTNQTNISSCDPLTTTAANDLASATTTGFSSFFLTEDTTAPAPVVPTGGGGGGGGGGLGGPTIIYVTPTPEGASVQVKQGDELIVIFKDKEYHFRIAYVGSGKVQMRSLETYLTTEFNLGESKTIGLTSFFARDVEVEMFVSNRIAMLSFKTIEEPRFRFPLLPPKPSTRVPAPATEEIGVERPTAVVTPGPAPAEPEAAGAPLQEIPEAPIGIWTIIIAAALIIFLVGGAVLYRTKLHRLEKPPTVTRTGLEPSGLPETSSKVSKPAPVFKEKAVEEIPKREAKPKPAEPVEISKAKKLELEKYIFHAFSMGFKEAQVRKALIEKGWPEESVDKIMEEIRLKK